MSDTRYFYVDRFCAVRRPTDGTTNQGCGQNKRIYAGRQSGYDYYSFLRFALDFTGVGKIRSAKLNLYSDDAGGKINAQQTADAPRIYVRRNKPTDSFSDGNNADEVWDSSDYTWSEAYTTDQVLRNMSKAANGLTQLDITEIVEDWAPTSVARHDSGVGGKATNTGIQIRAASTDASRRWAGWSNHATEAGYRPVIELTFDPGATKPNVPINCTPQGSVTSLTGFEGDFTDSRATDTLLHSEVEVYPASATVSDQTVTGTVIWKSGKVKVTNNETVLGRSNLVPSWVPTVGTTYKWRMRQYDQESQVSNWTTLFSFTVTNTAPTATITGGSGTYASLAGVDFKGGYSDPDGDALSSYQIQLSAYPVGDPAWNEADFILWDTGRTYVSADDTTWSEKYGGSSLVAGTYYFRARVWDDRGGVSGWAYSSLVLTADFQSDPGLNDTSRYSPRAPWRIVIRNMKDSAGTPYANRRPGQVVAIIENAKSVGASKMLNAPGELHFTLPTDHPQISVIEPKQTHYSVQIYSGDGWREVFAGLIWDFDATEQSVIFYGVDYLGLFNYVYDERYDPANPDKPAADGGSKYVNKTLSQIITDQIDRAIGLANSPVDFITRGSIASMPSKITMWSTMQNTLQLIVGLIESHKGAGDASLKNTRVQVVGSGSSYQIKVTDLQGEDRPNLRMKYGELVQGYRVVPFGNDWASVQHAIGRTREGIKVMYKTALSPTVDQSVWGRVAKVDIFENISDENDLLRRARYAALKAGKIGKQVGIAVRSGVMQPLDGYDLGDSVPIEIIHGAVNTTNYGSDYWTILGVAWECGDDGETNTTLSLKPKEDLIPADNDLIDSFPISVTPEWQMGYAPPENDAAGQWYFNQADGSIWRYGVDPSITDVNDPNYGLDIWYLWGENPNPSLTVTDPDDLDRKVKIEEGKIWISDDGGVTWRPFVSGAGANADEITDGSLPGGSNLIPDGSFELTGFPTAVQSTASADTETQLGGITKVRLSTSGTGTAAVIQLTSASF